MARVVRLGSRPMDEAQRTESPVTALRRLVNGYQAAQAIHVAASLGIADLLADGAKTSDELAAATETHAEALYRLLRALAAIGVFHEDEDKRFSLTPLGEGLRTDVPESIAGWAAFLGRPLYWHAWGALGESVRTGENAFRLLHGTDVWEYRSRHPEESAIFDRTMMALTGSANRSLREAYDFGRFETLVDVGGGNGTLLAAILAANPDLRGVLFDQPHVVSQAEEVLQRAGVADRCEIVGGSFFDAVPAGGDAYLLKWIVHDWEDEQAREILLNCRRALGEQGALLLVERVLGPPNEGAEGKLSDLNMLVAPGGRERTVEEYDVLLASAGFRRRGVTPTRSGLNVIEAAPVTDTTTDWRAARSGD
jgi:hypothetical protein